MLFKSNCAIGLFTLLLLCTTLIQLTSAIDGQLCDDQLKLCREQFEGQRAESMVEKKVHQLENSKHAEELAVLQKELAMCRSERG
uniref:Uncharacterized protein n=1 Tax=Ditylenchus dipsaci TaxID=166011 RepID=A0A915ELR1_9BILA